jgi:DNA polymerase
MSFLNDHHVMYLNAMGITLWQKNNFKSSLPSLPNNAINAQPKNNALVNLDKTPSHDHSQCDDKENTWQTLASTVAHCQLCTLCTSRTQTVFGNGNKQAQWLFIGEAPGQKEDQQGHPFVGDAGQLLTEMLRAMNLTRDDVFVANILKCRPPNNRDPQPFEIEQCMPYLNQQIDLVSPKMIIAVGRIAAQTLLKTSQPIGTLRQKVHAVNNTPLIVVYHPAFLLRSPIEKKKTWQDLQFAIEKFNAL